jgi:D-alanine-D-alanine ligase
VTKSAAGLSLPVFVKPTRLGSSIGISRVSRPSELTNALEVAFHYDEQVIVEEEVPNLIELTLPILGPADKPVPALLEKPLTKPGEFFDFDTKYMDQGKKGGGKGGKRGAQGYSEVPARIDKKLYAKAEKVAMAAYRALGCDGIARVDLLANGKTGDVYFNEVNPLPGSLYTHNWQKAGWSSVQLVEKLIGLAEQRAEREAKASVTFDTNFLKQF